MHASVCTNALALRVHKYPFSVLISCFPFSVLISYFPFSVLRRPPSPLHALLAYRPSSTNPTLQYSSPRHTLPWTGFTVYHTKGITFITHKLSHITSEDTFFTCAFDINTRKSRPGRGKTDSKTNHQHVWLFDDQPEGQAWVFHEWGDLWLCICLLKAQMPCLLTHSFISWALLCARLCVRGWIFQAGALCFTPRETSP